MKRIKSLIFGLYLIVLAASCSKDKDEEVVPTDEFTNTSWQPSATDNNPSTNPPGEIGGNNPVVYYLWQDCNLDDTFKFADQKLAINNGGTTCENDDLITLLGSSNYTYNESTKSLTIGLFTVDVLEKSNTQLKLGFTPPTMGVPRYYILVFKKI